MKDQTTALAILVLLFVVLVADVKCAPAKEEHKPLLRFDSAMDHFMNGKLEVDLPGDEVCSQFQGIFKVHWMSYQVEMLRFALYDLVQDHLPSTRMLDLTDLFQVDKLEATLKALFLCIHEMQSFGYRLKELQWNEMVAFREISDRKYFGTVYPISTSPFNTFASLVMSKKYDHTDLALSLLKVSKHDTLLLLYRGLLPSRYRHYFGRHYGEGYETSYVVEKDEEDLAHRSNELVEALKVADGHFIRWANTERFHWFCGDEGYASLAIRVDNAHVLRGLLQDRTKKEICQCREAYSDAIGPDVTRWFISNGCY